MVDKALIDKLLIAWLSLWMGGFCLYLFLHILVTGRVTFWEPNTPILIIETAMAVALILFGFW